MSEKLIIEECQKIFQALMDSEKIDLEDENGVEWDEKIDFMLDVIKSYKEKNG